MKISIRKIQLNVSEVNKKIWKRRVRRISLAALAASVVAVNIAQKQRQLDIQSLESWDAQITDAVNPSAESGGILRTAYLSGSPLNKTAEGSYGADWQRERNITLFRQAARATALDLFGTGYVSVERSRDLASVIVSEATRQKVPVALVLGVMRVENTTFKSRARSMVGATGLMQIMPKVWLPSFGGKHGWDLENDTTNIKMGISILAYYLKNNQGDWRTALLRYNGCVKGTNTPRCWTYPQKVIRAVERDAKQLCQDTNSEECLTKPLILGQQPRPPKETRVALSGNLR